MSARTPLMLPSLRGYRPAWLRSDLLAGLTVWAVLVPESLAYATFAGVPPVIGLYAAVPSLVLYPVLGSSRHPVVASMSATSALSASIVALYARAGTDDYLSLTATLAIVTGCWVCRPGCCGWASWPPSSPSRCSRASYGHQDRDRSPRPGDG